MDELHSLRLFENEHCIEFLGHLFPTVSRSTHGGKVDGRVYFHFGLDDVVHLGGTFVQNTFLELLIRFIGGLLLSLKQHIKMTHLKFTSIKIKMPSTFLVKEFGRLTGPTEAGKS